MFCNTVYKHIASAQEMFVAALSRVSGNLYFFFFCIFAEEDAKEVIAEPKETHSDSQ